MPFLKKKDIYLLFLNIPLKYIKGNLRKYLHDTLPKGKEQASLYSSICYMQ
jgi:hypothetical protein